MVVIDTIPATDILLCLGSTKSLITCSKDVPFELPEAEEGLVSIFVMLLEDKEEEEEDEGGSMSMSLARVTEQRTQEPSGESKDSNHLAASATLYPH